MTNFQQLHAGRELTDHELDAVSGGSIVGDITRAVSQIAGAIGGAVGTLTGGSSFPIKIDFSGATKAGKQIGHGKM